MSKSNCIIARALAGLFILMVATPSNAQTLGKEYDNNLRALASMLISDVEESKQAIGTVLDFTDLQGQGTVLGRFLAQELSDKLVSVAKTFSLVDRTNLQYLLRENKLSSDGFIDPKSRRKMGNMLGIDTVIFGSVTPIEHEVRLSVRAISVETGKIISARSTLIPATQQLLGLYTQGIAGATSELASSSASPRASGHFRHDSIRITGKYVIYDDGKYGGAAGQNSADATASFVLENLSGVGFEAAMQLGSQFVGPCVGTNLVSDAGLKFYQRNFEGQKVFVPPNARVPVVFKVGYCRVARTRAVSVGMNLTISVDGKMLTIPLSVDDVPVQ